MFFETWPNINLLRIKIRITPTKDQSNSSLQYYSLSLSTSPLETNAFNQIDFSTFYHKDSLRLYHKLYLSVYLYQTEGLLPWPIWSYFFVSAGLTVCGLCPEEELARFFFFFSSFVWFVHRCGAVCVNTKCMWMKRKQGRKESVLTSQWT